MTTAWLKLRGRRPKFDEPLYAVSRYSVSVLPQGPRIGVGKSLDGKTVVIDDETIRNVTLVLVWLDDDKRGTVRCDPETLRYEVS